MFIDTHCHLNFKVFEHDWKEVIEQSLREHVQMIIVGTDRSTSEKAVEIANRFGGVWAAVGFHPIHVADRDWRAEIQYVRALAKERKVVAIGEIGLDYYRLSPKTTTPEVDKVTSGVRQPGVKQDQETVFRFFIDIAQEVGKPLMLHCREAEEEFLEILSNKLSSISDRPSSRFGQWHCFGGSLEHAQKALKLGLNLGFTGLITYNVEWDKVIESLPLDRIMTETDAPYLTPDPYRGQRNEPIFVKEVVKKIAELKKLSNEAVEGQTYKNAQQLYNLV